MAITYERPNQFAGKTRGWSDIPKYEGIMEKFCYLNNIPHTMNITSSIYKFGTGRANWGKEGNRKQKMINCMNRFLMGEQGESVIGDNEADALANLLLTNHKQLYSTTTPMPERADIEKKMIAKYSSLLNNADKKVQQKVADYMKAEENLRDYMRPIIHKLSVVFVEKYKPSIDKQAML